MYRMGEYISLWLPIIVQYITCMDTYPYIPTRVYTSNTADLLQATWIVGILHTFLI